MKFEIRSAKGFVDKNTDKDLYLSHGFTTRQTPYGEILEGSFEMDIKSLEDLINLSKKFGCDLIIGEGSITIYDSYIEQFIKTYKQKIKEFK